MSPIVAVQTDAAAFVDTFGQGPEGEPVQVNSLAGYERIFGPADCAGSEGCLQVAQFFRNGGSVAWILRAAPGQLAAAVDPVTSPLTAIAPGRFGILSIPATAHLADTDARPIWRAVLDLCRQQRAFFIVDPPATFNDTKAILQWTAEHADLLHDSRVAVYHPRLIVGKAAREIGCSGAVAGIYARTDLSRGVWKAPAGNQAGIRDCEPARVLTDAEQELLTVSNINAIRQFPTIGTVCWGARTLDGGEWKYVPVRRLADMLAASILANLKQAVSEPNSETLWSAVRRVVADFLNGLWRQGAFQGATDRDAYFVKCDASTTTQADIDEGVFNVLVGFAPLKPAEFILLKLRGTALAG